MEKIQPRQMIPKPKQRFLRGILRIRRAPEQPQRITINLVAMSLA